MEKTITSIVENKKKKQYLVSFGLESLILSLDAFTDHYLYVGKQISTKEYLDLKKLSDSEKAYTHALSLALKGSYSSYQIKEKIKKDLPEGGNPSYIIARLKNNGFLDDRSLAKEYKEEKEGELYGKLRIRNDLLNKKMISEDIVNSLEFNLEEENAKKYASLIERKYASLTLNEKKRKALNALMVRGFSKADALKAVSFYKADKELINKKLQKDYSALLAKYSSKYSEYESRRRIYAALLRKGYNTSEIKNVMDGNEYD